MRELARATEGSVSHAYISQLESGVAPWAKISTTVLIGLARGLDMGLDDLVEQVDGRGNAHRAPDVVPGKRIPVYEMVGAGEPLDGGEVLDHVTVPLTWRGDYIAYRVEGDSMSPQIPDGATVVCKATATARPGNVIVCYVPDEGMLCKQLNSIEPDGTWVLGSFNPHHRPIYSRDVTVMGVLEEIRTPAP